MLDGEIVDGGDTGVALPRSRRRGQAIRMLGVAMVGVLLIAGIVVTRTPGPQAAPLAAVTASAPATPATVSRPALHAGDVLDQTGIGLITIGMSGSDYRRLFVTPGVADSGFSPGGSDDERSCTRYQDYTQLVPTYVWIRDGTVVTVGVSGWYPGPGRDGDVPVATAFDATVGEAFDLWERPGWQVDGGAPVPVARRIEGDSIVTLADIDADGTLDFASVGTVAGDECQMSENTMQTWYVADGAPLLEGGALLGLSLGMPAAQVDGLPAWTRDTAGGDCVMYWAEQGTGNAYVLDDVVIGIQGFRMPDGPAAGQTVDQAIASMGGKWVHMGEPQLIEYFWETGMSMAGAADVVVQSLDPTTTLDGLDAEVRPPVSPGERIIQGFRVGDVCGPQGGSAAVARSVRVPATR